MKTYFFKDHTRVEIKNLNAVQIKEHEKRHGALIGCYVPKLGYVAVDNRKGALTREVLHES